MRYKLIDEDPKTFALIFDAGDELVAGLERFAVEQDVSASSFTAIGALSSVTLAWFDWETKEYRTSVDLNEQVELLSLIGDIVLKDGEPVVHGHVVVGRRNGTAHGGHLQEAIVRPTCELILTETPAHLTKHIDPESGLALIHL
ncbi:PPC domain-containing DNA-binding protein [Homoserinimonas sp. OAct 916]|uniref:PPC domain-containing DNA-binding protein n=1 Tax=Homoserinimonas sp. OAct 916 TaxID=2211450 RepID=UPI000DBE05B5|nr:DUF296 domain-containing protein [Homoserinimonas sp. OAct 916]